MFKFRLYKTQKRPELSDQEKERAYEDGEYDYHVRQIFVGHHSIITLIAFTVGGILVGRSLYEILVTSVGLMGTIGVGLFLFAAAGFYIGSFRG